jgi:hypothetical protein
VRTAIAAFVGVVIACGGWLARRGDPPARLPAGRTPVVVELFSSEGCSSCPPADAYLAALDREQPIDGVMVLALEEHVDYWDRLGWKDPFGDAAFGDRQADYARVLDDRRVFTPEIVIDGRRIVPGGDEDAARALMQASAREPKARVDLRRDGARVVVDVHDVPPASAADAADVWLAITESGLATDVKAGENGGRRLAHAPVVRRLRSLGPVGRDAFHAEVPLDVDPAWKPRALRVVAFVQSRASRAIVGAAAL